jgi:hypothetical protein
MKQKNNEKKMVNGKIYRLESITDQPARLFNEEIAYPI